MNSDIRSELQARYTEALRSYVQTHSESALFSISGLSKEFMSEGLGPDDVINMHSVAMGRIVSELSGDTAVNAFHNSTEPLLELMMNYALVYHANMEKNRKQIAEYEGGEKAKDLEKLASIGMLLLGMTGEIINHMETIKAYSEMMGKGGITRAKEFSQVIMQETGQAQEMLKTAFLYSRKVAKRADERMPVNVSDLLVESIDVVRNAIRLDSVAIQTNYKTLVKINVNPVEMHQALVNLIAGAIDAAQGSGNLMISTTIEESGEREKIALRIISSNNGTVKRTEIFSLPMARTNIGLHIAANIVRRLGGTIDIQNSDGGIAIIIRFPIASKVNDFIGGVGKPKTQLAVA
ncbi:MAG: phosphatase RsbU N-terminal domain-containing protein [Dehalococcoidia bacterium]